MISIALHETGIATNLDWIRRADSAGVPRVWLTSGNGDALSLYVAAALQTQQIGLGTAIVPTWLRHPLVLANQAEVVETLAPGRLCLGVGPSHEPMMRGWYGADFRRPLRQVREYVEVLRQAFGSGQVDFDGEFFQVHAPAAPRCTAPIMVSALREGSFRLAGEIADGAIAWICPAPYLASKARPALQEGADKAGRPCPSLIAHTLLCVNEDPEAVRQDARKRLAFYPTLPFYQRMLAEAGDFVGAGGVVSDAMIEAVVIHGSEADCARQLQAFQEQAGADEVIASLMAVGEDREGALSAALRAVVRANQGLALA